MTDDSPDDAVLRIPEHVFEDAAAQIAARHDDLDVDRDDADAYGAGLLDGAFHMEQFLRRHDDTDIIIE